MSRRSGRASAAQAAAAPAAAPAAPLAPTAAPGSDPLAAALAVAPSVHPQVARLRRDWRFAAVCQFLWSFSDALGVSPTSSAVLEHDLSEGGGARSADVIRKLLRSLTLQPVSEASWLAILRAQYARRAPERQAWLGSDAHPRPWRALPLALKTGVLHDVTEWFMQQPERFRKLVASDDDLVQWGRIEPIGWDRHANTYWLFDDNRLWVQYAPASAPEEPSPSPQEPTPEPEEPPPPRRQSRGKAKGRAAGAQGPGRRSQGRRSTRNSTRNTTPEETQDSEADVEEEKPQLSARELRAQARQQTRVSPRGRKSRRVSRRAEEEWEDPPAEWLNDTSVDKAAVVEEAGLDERPSETEHAKASEPEAAAEMDVDAPGGHENGSVPGADQEEADRQPTDEAKSGDPAASSDPTTGPEGELEEETTNKPEGGSMDEAQHEVKDEPKSAEQLAEEQAEVKRQEEEAAQDALKQTWAEWDAQFERDAIALEVPLPDEVDADGNPRPVEMEVVCVTRPQWEAFAAALRPPEKPKSHRKGANKGATQDPDEAALHAHLAVDVLDRIRADLEAQAKAEAMEVALASRKRSSRLVAREEEQQRAEEEAQAQADAEARILAARQAEEEAERAEREKVGKARAREDRLRARLEEQQARREKEEQERAERERNREERKRKRDERLSSGAPSTPLPDAALPDATSPRTPVPPLSASGEDTPGPAKKAKIDYLQDWEFACEVCGIHGHNLMAKGRTVACESCGVWQHTQCWSKFLNRHGVAPPKWDDAQMVFYCTEHRPEPILGANAQPIERPVEERQRRHDEKLARAKERRLARKSLTSEGTSSSPPTNGPALPPTAPPSVGALALPGQAAQAQSSPPAQRPANSSSVPPPSVVAARVSPHLPPPGASHGPHRPAPAGRHFAPPYSHAPPPQFFPGGRPPAAMPPGGVRPGGLPVGYGPGYYPPGANGRLPVQAYAGPPGPHRPGPLPPGGGQAPSLPAGRPVPVPLGMSGGTGAPVSPLDALAVAAAQGQRLGAPLPNMSPQGASVPAVGNGMHHPNGSMNGRPHASPSPVGSTPQPTPPVGAQPPAQASPARPPSASPTTLPARPTSPTMSSLRRAPSTPGSFPLRYQAKASPLTQPALGAGEEPQPQPRPGPHGRAPSPSLRD